MSTLRKKKEEEVVVGVGRGWLVDEDSYAPPTVRLGCLHTERRRWWGWGGWGVG